MRLVMSQAVLSCIRTHVEAEAPLEACGLLVGKVGAGSVRITRAHPAPNLLAAPDRFEIDPGVRISLQRTLRNEKNGESIVGHYHSHPDADAIPSETDKKNSEELNLIWLIVSLLEGRMVAWQGYEARAEGLISVPIRVADEKNDII